jgi:hypothetical protein
VTTPSSEQQAILTVAKTTNDGMLVEALAGTGKTWTLVECIKVLPQASTIVLAFNTRIADEMTKRLPKVPRGRLVHVKTLHSAGFWIARQHFPNIKLDKNESERLVDRSCVKGTSLRVRGAALRLLRTVKDFQYEPVLDADLAYSLGTDYGAFDKLENGIDMQNAVEITQRAYELSVSPEREKIDFCDMTWLPLVLGLQPPSRYKAVLIDEVQDVSPNQFAMVDLLLAPGGRVIACGDRNQCHPAGTLVELTGGDRIPIEQVRPGMEVVSYHDVFRGLTTQGRKVLKTSSRLYKGELLTLFAGKQAVRVTPNHRVPTKFVKDDKPRWALYLMEYGETSRLGCCRLFYEGGTGSFGPSMRARHEGADRCWVLDVFESKEDALVAKTLASLRWGIPEHIFKEKGAYKSRLLRALGNNRAQASSCLEDFGRYYEYPLYVKGVETHVSRTYSYVTEACNLLPGLNRLRTFHGTSGGGTWAPVKIIRWPFKGRVYSLAVEATEGGRQLYVADRILVHNSIYGWRGATPEATWEVLKDRYKTRPLPLTTTWRCDQAIVKQANEIVPSLRHRPNAGPGEVTTCTRDGLYQEIPDTEGTVFVLSRTNAWLLKVALEMWQRGMSFNISQSPEVVWPLKDIVKKIGRNPEVDRASSPNTAMAAFKQALGAWRMTETMKADQAGSSTWAERVEEQFQMLTHCMGYVSEPYAIPGLLDTIFTEDPDNEILLSTVHKAKGLEADHVFLLRETFARYRRRPGSCGAPTGEGRCVKKAGHEDFRDDDGCEGPDIPLEEYNVEYVGITRARHVLTWVHLEE